MDKAAASSCKVLLAAAMLSVLACVAAASDVQPGETGSYVILKDGHGRPLAGAYRIGEGTKRALRDRASGVILVDREFLPRRMTLPFTLNISRFEYEPDVAPEMLVEGNQEFQRSHFTSLPDLSSGGSAYTEKLEASDSVHLIAKGPKQVTIGGVMTHRLDYEMPAPLPFGGLGTATSRVYFPEFDIDLDAAAAEDIAAIEQGTASSSEDFAALYLGRGATTAAAAACIEERRASGPYRKASARYRAVADAHTAKSFPANSCQK